MDGIRELNLKCNYIEDYLDLGKVEFKILRLELNGQPFDFQPGQFVMLAMEDYPLWQDKAKLKWTSMSIASTPLEKEYLEFCMTIKSTPGFSKHVGDTINVGVPMLVKGPYGRFILDQGAGRIAFIATGSGIAPIMGMIRTLAAIGYEKPFDLYYGFRNSNQFLYREELLSIVKSHPNFKIHTTISRDDPSWKGRHGYVQTLIEPAGFDGINETQFYICGNPAMVDDIKKLLAAKGAKPEQVRTEQWA
ncbi:MAG: hypothetical protein HY367_03965 [Candidatus Aenigmarchaeota archaeon]|nr:hypothetical protein [Candidatus Aenigmarchaeota archaeon]